MIAWEGYPLDPSSAVRGIFLDGALVDMEDAR